MIVKKLNNYETPEIIILELNKNDLITTSIGDSGVVEIGDEW